MAQNKSEIRSKPENISCEVKGEKTRDFRLDGFRLDRRSMTLIIKDQALNDGLESSRIECLALSVVA
ncbi:hypothetical protein L596_000216 [Steinernema carpocapsae]|uniref:Uncharacterized protein n=1 Tax=Steinernema carpocapsae TaxID=34508 RepID=A0A4U8UHM0_STECR|nr:hypothetical protein L596_000214 [Steinernema carpocapsae]TMS32366.1 hypothetical protein L596_000216 [Steinernema carpocapsae]